MKPVHKSVLLKEAVDALDVREDGRYVDATLGQAGHALEIIRRGGKVLGIEANSETREWLSENIKEQRLRIVEGNFVSLKKMVEGQGWNRVDGVIFDLGLSTFELKQSGRGFSYSGNEPLDMRLDPFAGGPTAADLLNGLGQKELYEIFIKFGEIRDAFRLSQSLVPARALRKFKTTRDLISLVESALQPKNGYKVLSQVFQALRMAVNRELSNLGKALDGAEDLLGKEGRLVIISFHSLEDRLTKRRFLDWQKLGLGKVLTKAPLRPTRKEIFVNPAARSAKLRVFEKV